MNCKIPVSKLADQTAAGANCSSTEAMQFIKDLFTILEEEVSSGKELNVPGLGVFSKSSNSVEPIAFVPEADFAAALNEDFSSFSPTLLNDEVSEEILNKANENDITETAVQEITSSSEPYEADLVDIATANDELPPELPEEIAEEIDEISISDDIEEKSDDSIVEKIKSSSELIEPSGEAVVAEEHAEIENAEDEAIEPGTTDNIEPDSVIEIAEISASDLPESSTIEEEPVEYVIVKNNTSRFWIGFIVGLLLGIILGIFSYIYYMVQILRLPIENITGF